MKTRKTRPETSYFAKGVVYGKYWGGGSGWYAAKSYYSPSKKGILRSIAKDLGTGAIDSGMGYEQVLGARMDISRVQTMKMGRQLWTTNSIKRKTFGQWKRLPRGVYM